MIPRSFILISSFILLFGIVFLVFAQNRMGITISPFLIEKTVRPGQNFKKIITITNNSDREQTFFIQLKDFQVKRGTNEVVFLPPGSEKTSLFYWLEVPTQEIKILPGQSKKVVFNFRVPEGVTAGSYYGAIIFSSQIPNLSFPEIEEEKTVRMGAVHQLSVFAFFRFLEGAIEKATIKEFKTEKNYYYITPLKIRFLTRIENLGNVYLKPSGLIKIQNIFTKEVAFLPFNSENFLILPATDRLFENVWQTKLALGRYTATLYLTFGTLLDEGGMGVKTISAKTSFWVFPWKVIVVIVLILVFFVFLFYPTRKRVLVIFKKRNNKSSL